MPTTTTRMGLSKPLSSENIDVTVLNSNSDLVDARMGFAPVTSATRPSSAYNGQAIRETDTGLLYVHNGSTPVSAGWVQVLNTAGNVSIPASAQFIIGADVNLYRSAASVLKTDSAMIVVGATTLSSLTVTGNETVSGSTRVAGNTTVGGTFDSVGTITQNGKAVQLKNRIFSGAITITPVANTPTLGTLTYTTLDGTFFRAWATASTTVPGTTVTGVSVATVTASATQVYVTRTNTTNTAVNVLVVGSDV